MRANAFPGFVTDDVMCYQSPTGVKKPLPVTEAVLLYNKKFSVATGDYEMAPSGLGRLFAYAQRRREAAWAILGV